MSDWVGIIRIVSVRAIVKFSVIRSFQIRYQISHLHTERGIIGSFASRQSPCPPLPPVLSNNFSFLEHTHEIVTTLPPGNYIR